MASLITWFKSVILTMNGYWIRQIIFLANTILKNCHFYGLLKYFTTSLVHMTHRLQCGIHNWHNVSTEDDKSML